MFKKSKAIYQLLCGLLTLEVLFFADRAQAFSLLVDDFSEPESDLQSVVIRNPKAKLDIPGIGKVSLPSIPNYQSEPFTSILGEYRDLSLTTTQVPAGLNTSSTQVIDEYLSISNDTDIQGTLKVVWDGDDDPSTINPLGLRTNATTGIDLTLENNLDGILLGILSADHHLDITFDVYTDANNYSTAHHLFTESVDSDAPVNYFFSFDRDFQVVKGSGADFSNVGALQMTISGLKELDAKISFVKATQETIKTHEVPEPNLAWFSLVSMIIIGSTLSRNS
jgi:hypothetical protein